MRIRTTREQHILRFKTTLRWMIYYLLIFISFIIMTSGTLYKPILLVPLAVGIAVNNNIYASAVTGAICGFLIDICCGKLFGYNAVILTVFCIAANLVFELYLKDRFINYFIITAAAAFLQCWLDYKFYYQIWDYEHVGRIFRKVSMVVPFPFREVAPYSINRHSSRVSPDSAYPSAFCRYLASSSFPHIISWINRSHRGHVAVGS